MEVHQPDIIIVKRHFESEDEHHGGAWKIAFADFMTAMMSFFLVLWIINATDKETKSIIARYFNPVRIEEPTRTRKGIQGTPSKLVDADAPLETENDPLTQSPSMAPSPEDRKRLPLSQSGPDFLNNTVMAPTEVVTDSAFFEEPFEALDRIANGDETENGSDRSRQPDSYVSDSHEDPREPFKPFPQLSRRGTLHASDGLQRSNSGKTPNFNGYGTVPILPPVGDTGPLPKGPTRAPAGGDTSREANPDSVDAGQLGDALARIASGPMLSQAGPGIEVRQTNDGLLITLTDKADFGMFDIGSAQPRPRLLAIVNQIARRLKSMSGNIIVSGHTDAHPYKSKLYDNWRLSSARAQVTAYMLIRGGVSAARIERVDGNADRRLKLPATPFAAENRRVEILLRKDAR